MSVILTKERKRRFSQLHNDVVSNCSEVVATQRNSQEIPSENQAEDKKVVYQSQNTPQVSNFSTKVLNPHQTNNDWKNMKKQVLDQIKLKQFNQEQRDLAKKFEFEYGNYQLPVIILSNRSNILQCNQAFCFLTKFNLTDITGENLSIMLEKSVRHDHCVIVQDFFNATDQDTHCYDMSVKRSSNILTKQEKVLDISYTVQFHLIHCEGIRVQQCSVVLKPDEILINWEHLILHPNNQVQFLWTMMMLFLIFTVSISTPQNLVFQLEGEVDQFENFADVMFMIDILINFNVGYVHLTTKVVVMDRPKVAYKQLNGDFALDFISSFPFNQLQRFLNIGSNLQLLKMLKFVRFFRLIKVSKVFKGLNIIKKQIKSTEGRWLDELIYYFWGTFKLMEMICQLFLISHYQTCILVSLQYYPSFIEECFINKTYFNGQNLAHWMTVRPVLTYRQVLNELVATTLNQSRVDFFNNREFVVDCIWAIVGVAFFSLTIGNASQQILLDNEDSIKYKELINAIDDMTIDQELSEETVNDLKMAIGENRFKLKKANVSELKQVIDSLAQNQLLDEIQDPLKKSHVFFNDINIEVLYEFERQIKYRQCSETLFSVNKVATELQFVMEGKIKLLDRKHTLIAEFERNSLLGVGEFLAMQMHQEKEDEVNKDMNHINIESIKYDLDFIQEEEENFEVRRQYIARCIGNAIMLVIDYDNLRNICKSYPELYEQLKEQEVNQKQQLSKKHIMSSQNRFKELDDDEHPILIIFNNGIVFRKNKAFCHKFVDHDLVGCNIMNFISQNGALFNDFHFNVNNEFLYYTQGLLYQRTLVNVTEEELIVKKCVDISDSTTIKNAIQKKSIRSNILKKLHDNVKNTKSKNTKLKSNKVFDGTTMDMYILKFSVTEGPFINFSYLIMKNQVNERDRLFHSKYINILGDNGDQDLSFLMKKNSLFSLIEENEGDHNFSEVQTNLNMNQDSDDEEPTILKEAKLRDQLRSKTLSKIAQNNNNNQKDNSSFIQIPNGNSIVMLQDQNSKSVRVNKSTDTNDLEFNSSHDSKTSEIEIFKEFNNTKSNQNQIKTQKTDDIQDKDVIKDQQEEIKEIGSNGHEFVNQTEKVDLNQINNINIGNNEDQNNLEVFE